VERDEWLRVTCWRVMVAREAEPERLVFVVRWELTSPLRAWSPAGQRAHCSVLRNRGPSTTLLANMTTFGMGPSLAVEGATTREIFESYVEKILAPGLREGQVVVMDNLPAHKGGRVKELIKSAGCELLYLPPYSPELNPIEEAFAKVKGNLRKAEARTREVLLEAMGRALLAITSQDARDLFEHCGYRSSVQLF
jgi:transposase